MGSGKTVIGLTAMDELLASGVLSRILVIAPLTVCNNVWRHEAGKWAHLEGLDNFVAVATGNPRERVRALLSDALVVVLNVENVPWLFDRGLNADFDGLFVDESARMKDHKGKSFKALFKGIKTFKWRASATGKLTPEGLHNLWAQVGLVDAGALWGRAYTKWQDRWFFPTDYHQYQWEPKKGSAEALSAAMSPLTHMMPDYRHTLPPLETTPVMVTLPAKARAEYLELAATSVLPPDVVASNAAVLQGKLQQAASGFVYTVDENGQDKDARVIHEEKDRAATFYVDAMRRAGRNLLVVYWWQDQLELMETLGIPVLGRDDTLLDQWNAGLLPAMAIHPRNAAHGLNLQGGGADMLMLQPMWSADLYDQVIARLWRRGQTRAVHVGVLLAKDTVDEIMVVRREGKDAVSDAFTQHLITCAAQHCNGRLQAKPSAAR